MKRNTKETKGITLIALVITIIVLLILAGVSITILTGENGILIKAQEAKEKSEIANIVEKIQIDILEIQTKNNGEIKQSELDEILKKYDKDKKSDKINDEGDKIIESNNGYIIKVSDIWNGTPTDNEVKSVSPKEIFDISGDATNKMHIGDFINYDAGNWSDEEIKEIKIGEIGKEVAANNSSDLPRTDFQFGGFISGTSRNENVEAWNKNYTYIQENRKAVTGWRLFDITNEGNIVLISAGCPEAFCHFWETTNTAPIAEYILSGNIPSYSTSLNLPTKYTKRNWNQYINNNQKAIEAKPITKVILNDWYNKYMNYTDANVAIKDTFQSIYGTKYESMIDNYSFYWLASAAHSNSLLNINPQVCSLGYDTDGGPALGIRILVSLSPEVKILEKSVGTKTIVDPRNAENSWSYNIWELE